MSEPRIDGNIFYKRLEKLYKLWENNSSSFSSCDSIFILKGKPDDEYPQPKTSLFHDFIFGYEFTDTIIAFTKSRILFFVTQKKKNILDTAKKPNTYKGPNVEILIRNLAADASDSLHKIISYLAEDKSSPIVGTLNESATGAFYDDWVKAKESSSTTLKFLDLPHFVDEMMCVKDTEEIENLKISGKFSCSLMAKVIKNFESIIDDDKKVTHLALSNQIKALTQSNSNFRKQFKDKNKLDGVDIENLELFSPPIIQSGSHYNLEFNCGIDDRNLSSDVIICKIGGRYKDYNTHIIRTYMIDSDKSQSNSYKILYDTFQHLISYMVEGERLCDVYNKTVEFVKSRDESLISALPASLGFGIGLELKNSILDINASNTRVIESGMVINVMLSFDNLVSEKGLKYCLQLADTVHIKNQNFKDIFTVEIQKTLNEISYNMEADEEEESEKENVNKSNKMDVEKNGNGNGKQRVNRRTNVQKQIERKIEETDRKAHQLELLKKKNEEFEERINKDLKKNEDIQAPKKNLALVRSYATKANFPPEMKKNKIFVDTKNDSIILPILGKMVPFHVSLVKNVSKTDEQNFSNLRINFNIPVSLNSSVFTELKLTTPVLIRELSFKSREMKNLSDIQKKIKDLIKQVKVKEQDEKEKTNLVTQENLIVRKEKKISLQNMIIRPNITNRKTVGTLEGHVNGFRYVAVKGEKMDIIYKNIKHAFFQPCENELIVLVHFSLHNPILLGKKKTTEIQFYKEAGAQADDLDQRKRGNDYEEYELELKERKIRDRINEEVNRFTEQIEEICKLQFELPYRELLFTGVPFKSNVSLLPTVNCLVSLIEPPFFVVSLEEVEIVHFERITHAVKNFDMVFVFKNFSKAPHRITAIPVENLEMIKNWLDQADILFSEGTMNLNWTNIISKIKGDLEDFIENGGWNFLHEEADQEEEEENEEDPDPSFHESDYSGSESDEEYTEEDDESEFDEESEGEEDELSEEGLSWDEMEKRAAKMDKENAMKSEETNKASNNNKKRGKR